MRYRLLGPVLLAGAPFVATGDDPAREIVYAPEEGVPSVKRFVGKWEIATDAFPIWPGDGGEWSGPGIEHALEFDVIVEDVVRGVDAGRPSELVRNYQRVHRRGELEGGEKTAWWIPLLRGEEEGPLQNHGVVFRRNEDEGGYAREFVENDFGEERWLQGLREDMDLRAFLPKQPVERKEKWRIDAQGFLDALLPGGELFPREEDSARAFTPREGAWFVPMPRLADHMIHAEGVVIGTYLGLFEEDGTNLAKIAFEAEVTAGGDATDRTPRAKADQEYDVVETGLGLHAEGILWWNLDRNEFFSFHVSGEIELTVFAKWEIPWERGTTFPITWRDRHSGTFELTAARE